MKVVIQCAGSKHSYAGRLETPSGEKVEFVATPELCKSVPPGVRYFKTDDLYGVKAMTWRDELTRYNEETENPYKLLRAADLCTPNVYRKLTDAFGWESVFILSAGWGLIRANYLTPYYDITFSKTAKRENQWKWRDGENIARSTSDFNHLKRASISPSEEIHFFVGLDYLDLCYALVQDLLATKVIHFKSRKLKADSKRRAGFVYVEYVGPEKTNWHYSAAKDFAAEHGQRGDKEVD